MTMFRTQLMPWVIVGVFAAAAVMRATGPSDVFDGDQLKQADYVVDIMVRGNWLLQHHDDTVIATKPPLYNWLAAPLMTAWGEASDFWLKMPSLLAGLATLLVVWDLTRRTINDGAALLACLYLATTYMFTKQTYYARTDMLMTLFVTMQIWAAVRLTDAPRVVRWQLTFWCAAGLGIMTKGPVAVVLPMLALFGWWCWTRGDAMRWRKLGARWGVLLALAPPAAWAAAVYGVLGKDVFAQAFDQLVIVELFGHTETGTDPGQVRGVLYYLPPLLARTLPWSALALIGLLYVPWHTFRARDVQGWRAYRGVIVAVCWLVTTVVFMSLFPSKRIVRVLPAIVPLCLLAGWVGDAYVRCSFAGETTWLRDWARRAITVSLVLLLTAGVIGGVAVAFAHTQAIAVAGGIGVSLAAIVSAVAWGRKHLPLHTISLMACVLLCLMLDRHVFGAPAEYESLAHARALRDRVTADEGRRVMILEDAREPALRYLLLHPHRPYTRAEVEAVLAAGRDVVYVVGRQEHVAELPRRNLHALLTSGPFTAARYHPREPANRDAP